jgi:hypothetical protein
MDNERKSKGKKSKDKEQTEIEKGKEEGKGKGKGKGGKNAKKKAAAQSAILPSSLPPPPSLFVDKRKSSPSTSSSSTSSSSSSTSSSTSSSILKSGSREGPAVPLEAPFWDLLRSDECNRVLIAGCGGGYDLFSGLPLFFALRKMVSDRHGIHFIIYLCRIRRTPMLTTGLHTSEAHQTYLSMDVLLDCTQIGFYKKTGNQNHCCQSTPD